MEFFVCCRDRILSPMTRLEAELEAFAVEPINHIGYHVIGVDDEGTIHKVAIQAGDVVIL